MKEPDDRSFYDLMKECLESWLKACNEDYENYYSMENFIEVSECNEWEYYSCGDLYY